MKKILLISACVSVFTLSACEKKEIPENTGTTPSEVTAHAPAITETLAAPQSTPDQISKDNVQGIAQDFALIQQLNIEKTAEAQPLVEKLQQAIATGDTATRDTTAVELNNKRLEINKTLDELSLESTEGNQLRKSSIDLNLLAIELTNEGLKASANPEKIKSIMQQVNALQADIQQLVSDIEAKISA